MADKTQDEIVSTIVGTCPKCGTNGELVSRITVPIRDTNAAGYLLLGVIVGAGTFALAQWLA